MSVCLNSRIGIKRGVREINDLCKERGSLICGLAGAGSLFHGLCTRSRDTSTEGARAMGRSNDKATRLIGEA